MAIQVVIAGMGRRGKEWLNEVRSSGTFELAAVVDVDQRALDTLSSELKIPAELCFTELADALDQTLCQAVIVATPPDCHAQACETALSRRLSVMVEKPFTLRLSEAVRIVSLADRQQVPLLVAQNYRYMRSFRTARRIISEGALGRIGMVVCQYYRPPHDMATYLTRLPNNVLWGVGVHHLDALRHVLGKEVTSVAAESFSFPWGKLESGASLRVMFSFENDTRGFYSASYESSGHEYFERGQEFYARFVGERGTLHVYQRWLILCESGKLPRIIRRGKREVTEERVLLRQFEKAIVQGEPAEVSGRDNLKTMAILEACVRSARERTWINPQELLNEFET
jgi:predicted dehydrogenase